MVEVRLRALMRSDPHADAAGGYQIRSVYFDDPENSCLMDNEDGTAHREKWRIRAYNCDSSHLSLECKIKEGGMIRKESCPLTLSQYRILTDRNPSVLPGPDTPPLMNRLLLLIHTRRYAPRVIVQYHRTPFICNEGNVRVTLDRRIVSADETGAFFSDNLPHRPVLPAGQDLLEVKYDEFLPDTVYRTVQLRDMQQITFSKYVLCRRYALS